MVDFTFFQQTRDIVDVRRICNRHLIVLLRILIYTLANQISFHFKDYSLVCDAFFNICFEIFDKWFFGKMLFVVFMESAEGWLCRLF